MKKFILASVALTFALCACSDDSSSTTSAPEEKPTEKTTPKTPTVETKCEFTADDDVWEYSYVQNDEINHTHIEFNDEGWTKYNMTSKSTDVEKCEQSETIKLNSIICTDSLTYVVTSYASSSRNEDGTYGVESRKKTKDELFETYMEACKKYLK